MAQRQRTMESALNQENLHPKIATKAALPARAMLPRRPALGEVKLSEANKLSSVNNANPKKGNTTGALQALPKKTVSSNTTKTENTSKVQEKVHHNKVIPKKQENNLKCTHHKNQKVTENVKSYSSKQIHIIDPDENSKDEPQMVTEYLIDIFQYLRYLENRFPIRQQYLEDHPSSPKMRAILINWLVDVHQNFKLYPETLHLCVAIIDRYLQSNRNVGRNTLQLVGTSAMLIACKYEEMYIPDLEDFVYICDNTFPKTEILRMEKEILKKLDFSLGRPLSLHFLRRYNKIAQVTIDQHNLGKYLLEQALADYNMCHLKPSIQAAAACCLSIGVIKGVIDLPKVWTSTLVEYSTYEFSDFKNVIIDMACLLAKSCTAKHQTIRSKYASVSFNKISMHQKLNGLLIKKLAAMRK